MQQSQIEPLQERAITGGDAGEGVVGGAIKGGGAGGAVANEVIVGGTFTGTAVTGDAVTGGAGTPCKPASIGQAEFIDLTEPPTSDFNEAEYC